MAMTKGYVVYRTPIGTILLDWNNNLWTHGYPTFSQSNCVEVERGLCEGGPALPEFYAALKEKYGVSLTGQEEADRYRAWEISCMQKDEGCVSSKM